MNTTFLNCARRYSSLLLAVSVFGCSRREGTLLTCTIQAPSLSNNCMGICDRQHLAVYLPPCYSQSNRRFPVLYILPNFTASLWRYTGGSFQGFHLKQAMDRQVRSGAAQEMIIVMPNTVHLLGGSWYQNSPLTGNWEDYVVKDVAQYVDSHFRTIPSAKARALAGHGMGGTGALELDLKHPDIFGCVYAMSPAVFDPNGLNDFGIMGEKQVRRWRALVTTWSSLEESLRRKNFRDYIQNHLNSPSQEVFFEGLYLSYAAAFAPDLNLPYPHIEVASI